MVKSVKLFLLIALLFFLTDRALFFALKHLNEGIYTGEGLGKVNTFLKEKDSVDLLIFGSSRAAHHVNLNSNEVTSYNMGRDASKIAFSGALISTLKKKDQIILVHIDHEWLYNESYEGNDVLLLRFNSLINDDISDYFKKYYREEYNLSKVSKTYACNGKMLSIVKNTFSKGYDYSVNKGYEPIFPTEEQQIVFKKSLEINRTKMNVGIQKPLKVDGKFEDIVDFIAEKAADNNSKLVFFTSPSLYKVNDEVKMGTKDFFHSKGLTYLDHIDYFENIIINDWKDHTHLSNKGAAKYSEYLKKELQKLF